MSGAKVERQGGVHHLIGFLNDRGVLAELVPEDGADAVVIDLSRLTGLDAVGQRAFAQLMRSFGDDEVELRACPRVFIEALNEQPSLVGGPRHGRRVRSFFMPYQCSACRVTKDELVETAGVAVTARGVTLPPQSCGRCGRQAQPAVLPEDYLVFLLYAQ